MVLRCGRLIVALAIGMGVAVSGQVRSPLVLYQRAPPNAHGHFSLVLPNIASTIDLERLRAWITATREHQPGQADAAAQAIAAWPANVLEQTLTDVSELSQLLVFLHWRERTQQPSLSIEYRHRVFSAADDSAKSENLDKLFGLSADEQREGHANRTLERGALLHTDIASLVPPSVVAFVSALRPVASPAQTADLSNRTVRVADGEVQGVESNSEHWIYARYLLEAVDSNPEHPPATRWLDFATDPSKAESVRLWYSAASAWLAYQHRWSEAAATLARGVQLFPGDARLVFYSGAMHEVFASAEVQEAAQAAVRSGMGIGVRVDLKELAVAEGLLRAAVSTEPGSSELHLRLGRVLQLEGLHENAIRELKAASAGLTDDELSYDAALFLGTSQQMLGDRDAARASFERAEQLAPGAQSPFLALSLLARRDGNSTAALASLQRLLATGANQATLDPWWTYEYSHVRDAGLLMAKMRRTLWAGGAQ